MPTGSTRGRQSSITDKRRPGPPTNKDGTLAADVIYARAALLNTPEMRTALDKLSARRSAAWGADGSARDRVEYWGQVNKLAAVTGGLFSHADIDHYAREWTTISQRLEEEPDWAGVFAGVGLSCGRLGRGRRMTPEPIELAVRSIALQIGGLSATKADEQSADEYNRGRPPRYVRADLKWTIAVYRKRIRDRSRGL